jgi:hypothetical protein
MNQIIQNQPNLNETINQLSDSLKAISLTNSNLSEKEGICSELSQTKQLVNYVLIAGVIAVLFVYQYIENQE